MWIVGLIALIAGAAAVAFGGSDDKNLNQAAAVEPSAEVDSTPAQPAASTSTTVIEESAPAAAEPEQNQAPIEVAGQTASVDIVGEILPQMPQVNGPTTPENDSSIGLVAPTLTGSDFDGNVVTIAPDGRAKAVYFLAHWCPHCQVELPVVQALVDSGATPDGFDVYAVSTAVTAERGNYPPRDWFRVEQWSSPVMLDDAQNSAVISYGAGGFPYAVFLDGENRVVSRAAGELPAELTQEIWSFVAGF